MALLLGEAHHLILPAISAGEVPVRGWIRCAVGRGSEWSWVAPFFGKVSPLVAGLAGGRDVRVVFTNPALTPDAPTFDLRIRIKNDYDFKQLSLVNG